MRRLRLYADTSVFGGCFDEEYDDASRRLFEEVRAGRFLLVLSRTTLQELRLAPEPVRRLAADLPDGSFELLEPSREVELLRDAYLAAGVVGPASKLDAEHIAQATVGAVDVMVSWNFRHIVHFDKIRGYHAVNLREGYRQIPIHTPREVIAS